MCISAIIWANITEVYYGCTKEDASKIGFRDKDIYDYIKGINNKILNIYELDRNECIEIFNKYHDESKTIY